jgi:hypothetical protein
MVCGHFHEKAFTEVSYLELVCLDFKGTNIGFWLLKRQTFEILAPYLAGIFISLFSITFATTTFLWATTKNGLSILSVLGGHHSNFKRYGTLKNGHTRGFINFLGVLAYIAFFGHSDV